MNRARPSADSMFSRAPTGDVSATVRPHTDQGTNIVRGCLPGGSVTATWAPGSHRAGELADALAILGAGEPRMLGFADDRIPDSASGRPRLSLAPIEEVVGLIVGHIRAVRPQIVVTHDGYGQRQAIPITSAPTRPPSSPSTPLASNTFTPGPGPHGSPRPCTRLPTRTREWVNSARSSRGWARRD
ncbi:PIG-L deacetylase family protein [Streptomyces sp. NPDC002285]